MRYLEPEFLALGHTEPIRGAAKIQEILTAYRDAIAFLHAAVLQRTNQGETPGEMARRIQLPEHLRSHDYLRETYGRIEWSVRGIYEGYFGWFDGNATQLHPLPREEFARRMVDLIGGVGRVELAIDEALERGEPQWAAELCDLLLALDSRSSHVRGWKGEALERLGRQSAHPIARNYYASSAREFAAGNGHTQPLAPIGGKTLGSVPIELIMEGLPDRLRPEKCAGLTLRIGYDFIDSGKRFTFYIRRGVGEIRSGLLDRPDFTIRGREAAFRQMAAGLFAAARVIVRGDLECTSGLRGWRVLRSILLPP